MPGSEEWWQSCGADPEACVVRTIDNPASPAAGLISLCRPRRRNPDLN